MNIYLLRLIFVICSVQGAHDRWTDWDTKTLSYTPQRTRTDGVSAVPSQLANIAGQVVTLAYQRYTVTSFASEQNREPTRNTRLCDGVTCEKPFVTANELLHTLQLADHWHLQTYRLSASYTLRANCSSSASQPQKIINISHIFVLTHS